MIGPTLARYFFRRYIKITGYFLLGIFSLALLMDFTENAGRLAGLPGYSPLGALFLSCLRLPFIMQQLFPFVALFAAMATLVSLNRRLELVIARSIGISAWQFLLPVCFGAFLFGLFAVIAVNPLAAWSTEKAQDIIAGWRSNNGALSSGQSVSGNRIPWLTQKTDEGITTIGAKMVTERGHSLIDATFVRFNEDDTIRDWVNVGTAKLENGYWQLGEGALYRSGGSPLAVNGMRIKTQLKPQFIEERLGDPATVPFYELPSKIRVARSFGYSANEFDMYLQSVLALPALLVTMTLIAAAVSLKFVRLGQSGMLILGGIAAGFALYVVSVLVKAFGNAGYVPPVIAAWAPVLIALFFGISFLLHREDG